MSYQAGRNHFTNLAIAKEYLGKIDQDSKIRMNQRKYYLDDFILKNISVIHPKPLLNNK